MAHLSGPSPVISSADRSAADVHYAAALSFGDDLEEKVASQAGFFTPCGNCCRHILQRFHYPMALSPGDKASWKAPLVFLGGILALIIYYAYTTGVAGGGASAVGG